jgi:hypothetical protein
MTRHRSAVVLLACLLLPACKSVEEKDKEHPEFASIQELKEKLENVRKIEKDAKKKEPLTGALELKKKGKYLCLFIDPPKDKTPTVDTEHSLEQCTAVAKMRPGSMQGDKIDGCNDIRYVAALKTRKIIEPSVADNKTFTAGFYQYDVLLYDFESGKYKGGTTLVAENSNNVNAKPGSEADDKLLTDLLKNACDDVGKAIDSAAKSASK